MRDPASKDVDLESLADESLVDESLEDIPEYGLQQDLPEYGLSAAALESTVGPSRGYNTTNGSIGWFDDSVQATVLIDTGSDLSFISRRAFERIQDCRVYSAQPVRIRLTNGARTICDQIASVGLNLHGFRARSQLRILDWDAYDIILGMDWLKLHDAQWNLGASKLLVRNGSRKSFAIPMRPFRTIDYGGIEEAGLHLMSYKAARRSISKLQLKRVLPDDDTNEALKPTLILLREKKQPTGTSMPLDAPERYQKLLRQYSDIFREELPAKYPRKRDIKHDIDTGDSKPINISYYPLSREHRDEQDR
jgi:Retroviral aspartyl protease